MCTSPNKHDLTDPVKVCVRILRHVIVEDDVNSLDVHASPKEVCCNQDPSLEVFELLISG